ncbi:MAG: MFS transporter [Chloroflexota bacterium]|nr:MFS transporter [Chloroflexota bacterium]
MFLGELYGPIGFGAMVAVGVVLAIATQPTVGMISDYTRSRWGRRKPYIAIGTLLDVVFLIGIALADNFLILVALVILLNFSSNFAQGPFQGYIPDLVPARQVGLASGLMGLMIILGNITGVGLVAASVALGEQTGVHLNHPYGLAIVGIGIIEAVTALATLIAVDEGGRQAPPREGKSWLEIARSAWGRDFLAERSYLWMLATRLFLIAAPAMTLVTAPFLMRRTFGFADADATFWVFVTGAVMVVVSATMVVPAALVSNRIGRKPVIFATASAGALGAAVVALAPTLPVAIAGAALLGVGAGSFLAVDWALMSDIIPKKTTGRYMGLANVTEAVAATPAPALLAGAMITLSSLILADDAAPEGPRIAVAVSLILFVSGLLALTRVDPTRREAD